MSKKIGYFKKMRVGDYVRQFSIVAAGIIVTFVGSDLIAGHKQQKEVASVMRFVVSELEHNKQEVEKLYARVSLDRQMGKYLVECDYDVRRLPVDTLQKYNWFISSTSSLKYMSDALEVLKNSSLMQQVKDKEMLLNLAQSYGSLRQLQIDAAEFYRIKGDILTPMMLSMSRQDRDKIAKSSIYERYEMVLQNTGMQNFCIIAPDFFEAELFSNTLRILENNIELISQQYLSE